MTDLEIIKRCAEMMGFAHRSYNGKIRFNDTQREGMSRISDVYDPLHDDAQAMALVKKFQLCFFAQDGKFSFGQGDMWQCRGPSYTYAVNKDLNRAICECVAKLP